MLPIADFSETEQWIVTQTLRERYGHELALQFGDAEVRLDPVKPELTEVPVLVWEEDDVSFIIFKIGDGRYRAQFWYRGYQQYRAGLMEYDDLGDCVIGVLRAQADFHAKQEKRAERDADKQG